MYSKGISWIDDCRIPFVDDVNLEKKLPIQQGGTIYGGGKGFYRTSEISEYKSQGRFPANILVSDDMLNDGTISSQSSGIRKNTGIQSEFWIADWDKIPIMTQGDKGSNSRYYNIDKWFEKLLDD
jgi:hypothetical protein